MPRIERKPLLHASGLLLALAVGMAAWSVPDTSLAQSPNCGAQQAQAAPTATTGTNAAAIQNLRFNTTQKQALCLLADNLERHSLALSLDLTSALLPGTLGPVGPLANTDLAAHTYSVDTGTQFDLTLGATTAGLAGMSTLSTGLVGYLRALTDDSADANYTATAQAVAPPFVFPSVAADTNFPVAATFQALLVNESQALGVAQALVYSVRRARGAAAANNAALLAQHQRAAGLYAVQLATLLAREPRLRLDVQGALLTENLPTSLGDPALLAGFASASQTLLQFGTSQGVAPPVPPPPVPPNVPVTLPPPAPPPQPAAAASPQPSEP